MRFAVSSEQKDFFHKNQYLCLEEVLSPEKIGAFTLAIESTLCQRFGISSDQLAKKTGLEIYKAGHDLFRDNDFIKRTSQKMTLMSLAAELFELFKFRLAFDQYICTHIVGQAPFGKELSLEEMSSVSPLAGAMLIQLKNTEYTHVDFPLPQKAGSVLFFSAEMNIPWDSLFATPDLSFFLIVFGKETTLFRADTVDLHAIKLKKLGYVFGDKLNNALHPIIYHTKM